jgi:hypothetical protein
MTSEVQGQDPERVASGRHARVAAEHVDVGSAHIDVSEATIVQSATSRLQARYLAYALCVLFVVMIAIGGANLLFTSNQVHAVRAQNVQIEQNARSLAVANAVLRKQITADCGFDRDLSGLPLTNLPNGHPSELGVKIISDSRGAWAGHGCPGHLPPPDPTYVRGAKFYSLPVN